MSGSTSRRVLRTTAEHRAVALLALFVVAQLAMGVHRVAAPHSVCSEHGELVHGRVHSHAAEETPALQSAGADLSSRDDAVGHGDHCTVFLSSERRKASDPPRLPLRPRERPVLVAAIGERDVPPPDEPRYRLAPKQSPPH